MKKTSLLAPESWPPEAQELYANFAGITLAKRSGAQLLRRLRPFLFHQEQQGLSYCEFPPQLWPHYSQGLGAFPRLQQGQALRNWLRFLYRHQVLLLPLHEEICQRPVPCQARVVLSYQQILQLLALPDLATPVGLRDRAILEVAYSAALRIAENCQLNLGDIDLLESQLLVRMPKNGHDRLLPLNTWACHFLRRYLEEARPLLSSPLSSNALWLNRHGRRLSVGLLSRFSQQYRVEQQLGFGFTFYQLRHSCATHLLQQGANLRDIQELLGHLEANSTQRYTRVLTLDLQRVHRLHHPRNRDDFPGSLDLKGEPI